MAIYGISPIQNISPKPGGQSIGHPHGWAKGELPVLIIGDGDWHLIFATSICSGRRAQTFFGTMRDGMTDGAPGTVPNGSAPTTTYASTICDGYCGIPRSWQRLSRKSPSNSLIG